MIQAALASFVATGAFAILFTVRGKKILVASIIGMIAGFVFALAQENNVSIVVSQFLASVTLSGLSEICARKFKTPVTIFIVCALIPLVPGGGMYFAMKALMESNTALGNAILLDVLSQSGALVLGIVVMSTISFMQRAYMNRR